jgi:ABC-type sugar transport system ATPase subunit
MIELQSVSVRMGAFSLNDISFTIPRGQYGILMGKTGIGKTTLLESICGLRKIERGTIRLNDIEVTTLPPGSRGIGYVPQEGALFPTLTVREHLAFALTIRRWPGFKRDDRVNELATQLHIRHLLDRLPEGLSGGEKQRVAFGRALAFHPAILLLDEPLSALDQDTRKEMYSLLLQLRERRTTTVLHVTHNPEEAQQLGDLILRFQDSTIHLE